MLGSIDMEILLSWKWFKLKMREFLMSSLAQSQGETKAFSFPRKTFEKTILSHEVKRTLHWLHIELTTHQGV
jgi:hypothetical protein